MHPHKQPHPSRAYTPLMLRALAVVGGIIGAAWLFGTPPGILGKADAVGYAICHRIAERSFHAHDHQLPMCARCTGIYLGVFIGLIAFISAGRGRAAKLPPVKVLLALALPIVLYGFDGLNSYLSVFAFYEPVYQPHNTLRLLTGLTFGLGMITIVLPVFNMIVWQPGNDDPSAESTLYEGPSLASVRELGALYVAAGLAGLAVLWQQPAILAVVGVISAAMVLLLFAVIGAVMFVTISGRENALTHRRDLVVPSLAGLTFAVVVISVIDLARYLATGTWDGFLLAG